MRIYIVGTTVEIKHCKACGEEWCFRGVGRPIRCGKCKSPYWDKDRKIAAIAQVEERKPSKFDVAGSSPAGRSKVSFGREHK